MKYQYIIKNIELVRYANKQPKEAGNLIKFSKMTIKQGGHYA